MKRPLAYITAALGAAMTSMKKNKNRRQTTAVWSMGGLVAICPAIYLPLFLNDMPEEHKAA